ncbi:unnamed protein product [Vitrella brassicaformis CCMP3155]|uniref:peptidylprolyl isomerase n=1 Tax=Vitrella brassicaformis (strain CCMP3155) TaxID=1169540 RepID=A0A0G4EFJ2_VITBC|nr:unnamed protein product [Vitrella brassicaformis CCMP3155]|eukprot:CEL94497.1 unnamed protein product [Vitrella brassicaformis CCMP3155]
MASEPLIVDLDSEKRVESEADIADTQTGGNGEEESPKEAASPAHGQDASGNAAEAVNGTESEAPSAGGEKENENDAEDDQQDKHLTEKEQGNKAYRDGEYVTALTHWERSLRSCRYILAKKMLEEAGQKEIRELEKTLNLNMAIGNIKTKNYHEAIDYCDRVLEVDPANVKALFRKADALYQLTDYQEAIDILDALLLVDTGNPAGKQLKLKIQHDQAKYRTAQKKMGRAVVSGLGSDPRSVTPGTLAWYWRELKSFPGKTLSYITYLTLKGNLLAQLQKIPAAVASLCSKRAPQAPTHTPASGRKAPHASFIPPPPFSPSASPSLVSRSPKNKEMSPSIGSVSTDLPPPASTSSMRDYEDADIDDGRGLGIGRRNNKGRQADRSAGW